MSMALVGSMAFEAKLKKRDSQVGQNDGRMFVICTA